MERLESTNTRAAQPKRPEALSTEGFSESTIGRLVAVRERYQAGDYSEKTIETKRLEFVKWLHEHGRISE